MNSLLKQVVSSLKATPGRIAVVYSTLFRAVIKYLAKFLRSFCRLIRGRKYTDKPNERNKCLKVPPDVARRPDPCLYSQRYLAAQDIAVTWNNPDIVIANLNGTPADLPLAANREYLVRGTIHNASFDPALGVSVRSFFRPWGVDFEDRTPVEVDADGEPAQRIIHIGAWGQAAATFKWRTPDVDGHFCITVECFHPADREPANNVGQENTDVRRVAKAGSTLNVLVPFFNRQQRARTFRIEVDEYGIPSTTTTMNLEQIRGPNGIADRDLKRLSANFRISPESLGDKDRLQRIVEQDAYRGARVRLSPDGRRVRRGVGYRVFGYLGSKDVSDTNRARDFPLSAGWDFNISGSVADEQGTRVEVPPNTNLDMDVSILIPDSAIAGDQKHINVSAYDMAGNLVGGVTLNIEVEA